jgi:hypothetical protein
MKKRCFALAFACVFAVGLAACDDNPSPPAPAEQPPAKERPFNPPGDRR